MTAISELGPSLVIGATFTAFSAVKFYGLARGIEGGGGKPLQTRLCGS
ncbi:MAG: hypothetical protein AAB074_13045 [Planctomycetota bacterium]